MIKKWSLLFSTLFVLSIDASFAFDETKTKKDMPEVDEILYTVNMGWNPKRVGGNEKKYTWKVAAIDGQIATLKSGSCEQEVRMDMPFDLPPQIDSMFKVSFLT